MNKKSFIVFEGIDCSGKSTQATLLRDYLISRGSKAVISPEPSSGPIGNLIRETLKQRIVFTSDRQKFDEQMAYLFAADRHDHLYNERDGVFKLIGDGFNVITTRYHFSSLAYNSHTPEQFSLTKKLNENFPNPNLVIYLDLSVELSLARLEERSLKEVYENKDKLIAVSKNYQNIFNHYDGLLLKVNGGEDTYDIHKKIVNFILNLELAI
ncbi:MAG: dTMP kinase [Xenococcaceae cyanobacterium]